MLYQYNAKDYGNKPISCILPDKEICDTKEYNLRQEFGGNNDSVTIVDQYKSGEVIVLIGDKPNDQVEYITKTIISNVELTGKEDRDGVIVFSIK